MALPDEEHALAEQRKLGDDGGKIEALLEPVHSVPVRGLDRPAHRFTFDQLLRHYANFVQNCADMIGQLRRVEGACYRDAARAVRPFFEDLGSVLAYKDVDPGRSG